MHAWSGSDIRPSGPASPCDRRPLALARLRLRRPAHGPQPGGEDRRGHRRIDRVGADRPEGDRADGARRRHRRSTQKLARRAVRPAQRVFSATTSRRLLHVLQGGRRSAGYGVAADLHGRHLTWPGRASRSDGRAKASSRAGTAARAPRRRRAGPARRPSCRGCRAGSATLGTSLRTARRPRVAGRRCRARTAAGCKRSATRRGRCTSTWRS